MADAAAPTTTIGAVFDTQAALDAAHDRLRGHGVADGAIVVGRGPMPGAEGERNLMDGILDIFLPAAATAGDDEAEAHRLTVADVTPERRNAVAHALDAAGALHIYERAPAATRWARFVWHADADVAASSPGTPRAVQPGFADAPPGYVPDPAPFPAARAPETAEPEGRFAAQLDAAPGRPPRRGPARTDGKPDR